MTSRQTPTTPEKKALFKSKKKRGGYRETAFFLSPSACWRGGIAKLLLQYYAENIFFSLFFYRCFMNVFDEKNENFNQFFKLLKNNKVQHNYFYVEQIFIIFLILHINAVLIQKCRKTMENFTILHFCKRSALSDSTFPCLGSRFKGKNVCFFIFFKKKH